MGNETSHKTTQGEFTETSFSVLPKSECQKIFHGLSVFEMCARIVNETLNCNIQEGSPLGSHSVPYIYHLEFYIYYIVISH